MEGEPTAASVDKPPQRLLLVRRRAHVAGVGDEQVRGRDRLRIGEAVGDTDPHVVVLGEQRQQLETGEVGVVEAGVGDEVGVDAGHAALPREVAEA